MHTSYDLYDYRTFWQGREYDHEADIIAFKLLLKKADGPRGRIIDVGGGRGRMLPCYAALYAEAIVIDPSSVQLNEARSLSENRYPNVLCALGIAERIPFTSCSADMILCIRVSHHIVDFSKPIAEFKRVLKPGGYLILEIANKRHVKALLRALIHGNMKDVLSAEPIKVGNGSAEGSMPFVNHNPTVVRTELINAGFEIVAIRSASNFRSAMLKRVVPLRLLIFLERYSQRLLAGCWFGPSIYFLAKNSFNRCHTAMNSVPNIVAGAFTL